METKTGDFVSIMKDIIIKASIESIKKEGLRFSVDLLANRLKISKKTIYKYFPDKENLAIAMYEQFFCDALERTNRLNGNEVTVNKELLRIYFDCKWMTRSEIFNKYKLNRMIYMYTADKLDFLWKHIVSLLKSGYSEEGVETLRVIVDGTFEKLCNVGITPDAAIERLVNLL